MANPSSPWKPISSSVGGAPIDAVFLHGFNEAGSQWDAVLAELGDGVRPCTVDLPGHGRSRVSTPTEYSPAGVVDMVRRGLADAGVAPRLCVAHSAGASVGIDLALADPGIEHLVLLSPSIEGYPFAGDFGFQLRLVRQAAAADDPNKRFIRQWQLVHGLVAAMAADGSGDGLSRLFGALGGSVTFPPATAFTWHRLEEVSAAVTVVTAADDFPDYRTLGEALRARQPQWRRVALDSGGHDLPRTQTAAVVAAVRSAMVELSSGDRSDRSP